METPLGLATGLRILGVSEAARAIASTVRADEQLRDLWVEGEVGRVTISSAGHAYFALKDERAQLQPIGRTDRRAADLAKRDRHRLGHQPGFRKTVEQRLAGQLLPEFRVVEHIETAVAER